MRGMKRKQAVVLSEEGGLNTLLSSFMLEIVSRPEVFLNAQDSTKTQLETATKLLYDYGMLTLFLLLCFFV